MKKLMIIALVAFFSMATAGSVLAACTGVAAWAKVDVVCEIGTAGAGNSGTLELKGSKNVYMAYAKHTTGLAYAIGSYHLQGNRQFASSSGDQKLFWISMADSSNPTDLVGAPTSTVGGSEWVASWSAL